MTDLESLGRADCMTDFPHALQTVCAAHWRIESAQLERRHLDAIAEAEADFRHPLEAGGLRRVRHGLKINGETYLLEDPATPAIRLIWQRHNLQRIACADCEVASALSTYLGRPLDRQMLRDHLLSAGLEATRAVTVAERIAAMCDGLAPV